MGETTKETVDNVVDKVFPILPLTDGRKGDMDLLAGEEDIGVEEPEVFIAVDPVIEEETEEEEEDLDMEEEEEDLDMEEEEEEEDLDMELEEEEDLDMEEDLTINESENMAGTVFEDVPVKEEP